MHYYSLPDFDDHEQVVFFYDPASGLKAIVAIHDTTLGPALGGTRMFPYASDQDALVDVLRLSQGMTRKAAAAGLKLGGGKAVIIGDPKKLKSEALFRTFGKCVQSLGGRYITAEDSGTDETDMEYIRMETPYVTGVDRIHGGSGNPAPFTAFGVLQGMKAAVEFKLGKGSFSGLTIAIQGLGHVGWELAKLLKDEGAKVIGTDTDSEKLTQAKKEGRVHETVNPDEIYNVKCDVFAPCAMGAILNEKTISQLNTKIIAGAANNQLKETKIDGDRLIAKDILYVPDYVINAGGLINVYVELEGYSHDRALRFCKTIYYNCKRVFEIAAHEKIPTYLASERLVEQRIESMTKLAPQFNVYPRESFDKRR